MAEEWGPWIDHDGKGCPCVGEYVQAVELSLIRGECTFEAVAGMRGGFSWDWQWASKPVPGIGSLASRIIRYRIRKPRALLNLIEMVENLPANPVVPGNAPACPVGPAPAATTPAAQVVGGLSFHPPHNAAFPSPVGHRQPSQMRNWTRDQPEPASPS